MGLIERYMYFQIQDLNRVQHFSLQDVQVVVAIYLSLEAAWVWDLRSFLFCTNCKLKMRKERAKEGESSEIFFSFPLSLPFNLDRHLYFVSDLRS